VFSKSQRRWLQAKWSKLTALRFLHRPIQKWLGLTQSHVDVWETFPDVKWVSCLINACNSCNYSHFYIAYCTIIGLYYNNRRYRLSSISSSLSAHFCLLHSSRKDASEAHFWNFMFEFYTVRTSYSPINETIHHRLCYQSLNRIRYWVFFQSKKHSILDFISVFLVISPWLHFVVFLLSFIRILILEFHFVLASDLAAKLLCLGIRLGNMTSVLLSAIFIKKK
jgi:hypothetical protein